MSIDNVGLSLQLTSTQTTGTTAKGTADLGKDAFLKLLVEQLKNQNPFEPMDNREFLTQLAQFRSLEQLQSMENALCSMAAMIAAVQSSGLLGKRVAGVDEGGNILSGTVQALRFDRGRILLCLDSGELDMRDVQQITA